MELWDVGSGQMLRALKGHGGEIRGIAFSPDGALIASAGADGTLRVWDNSGQRDSLPIFQQPERLGNTVFSPDGKTLVVETIGDRRWHLVDALSGQRRGGPIEIDQQTDNCIGWSSDGGRLVFTGPDKTIAIRDAASGARVRSIRVDAGAGCVSDISPDGRWLAYSAPAGAIKIVDAETGEERRSIRGLTGGVHNLALSPDGSRLAGSDEAGWVRVWDTGSG
jgi:WD40 repeat protein